MKNANCAKQAIWMLLALVLSFGLFGCSYTDPVIDSLPDYEAKVFYSSGGFQDYTDYAKYTYESISSEAFDHSKYFHAVTAEDVEEMLSYIENFEGWVDAIGGELKENYDFDKAIVSEGNFFYIKTKDGEPIGQGTYGKFDHYTVYYFDIDTQILYYFHNNI